MAPKSKNDRDPRTLHKHTWYLADALVLVRLLQEALWPLHYHVTLGGSVLNNGYADKDVDIFVLPFNNAATARPEAVKAALNNVLTYVQAIGLNDADYKKPSNELHEAKDQWSFDGKRVDVFVVRLQQDEAPAAGQGAGRGNA